MMKEIRIITEQRKWKWTTTACCCCTTRIDQEVRMIVSPHHDDDDEKDRSCTGTGKRIHNNDDDRIFDQRYDACILSRDARKQNVAAAAAAAATTLPFLWRRIRKRRNYYYHYGWHGFFLVVLTALAFLASSFLVHGTKDSSSSSSSSRQPIRPPPPPPPLPPLPPSSSSSSSSLSSSKSESSSSSNSSSSNSNNSSHNNSNKQIRKTEIMRVVETEYYNPHLQQWIAIGDDHKNENNKHNHNDHDSNRSRTGRWTTTEGQPCNSPADIDPPHGGQFDGEWKIVLGDKQYYYDKYGWQYTSATTTTTNNNNRKSNDDDTDLENDGNNNKTPTKWDKRQRIWLRTIQYCYADGGVNADADVDTTTERETADEKETTSKKSIETSSSQSPRIQQSQSSPPLQAEAQAQAQSSTQKIKLKTTPSASSASNVARSRPSMVRRISQPLSQQTSSLSSPSVKAQKQKYTSTNNALIQQILSMQQQVYTTCADIIQNIHDDWNFKGYGFSFYKSCIFKRSFGMAFRIPVTTNWDVWERHPEWPSLSISIGLYYPYTVGVFIGASVNLAWIRWLLVQILIIIRHGIALSMIIIARGLFIAGSAIAFPITKQWYNEQTTIIMQNTLLPSLQETLQQHSKPNFQSTVQERIGVTHSWRISQNRGYEFRRSVWHLYLPTLLSILQIIDPTWQYIQKIIHYYYHHYNYNSDTRQNNKKKKKQKRRTMNKKKKGRKSIQKHQEEEEKEGSASSSSSSEESSNKKKPMEITSLVEQTRDSKWADWLLQRKTGSLGLSTGYPIPDPPHFSCSAVLSLSGFYFQKLRSAAAFVGSAAPSATLSSTSTSSNGDSDSTAAVTSATLKPPKPPTNTVTDIEEEDDGGVSAVLAATASSKKTTTNA